jgi:phosphotransferase system  glucose/maltose/N-acetylglucosamine-specific IIC component
MPSCQYVTAPFGASLFNKISSFLSHRYAAVFTSHRLIQFVYEGCVQEFVLAFVKFIGKNIGLVMSVCLPLSVLKETIGSQCMGFIVFIFFIFRNFSRRLKFH